MTDARRPPDHARVLAASAAWVWVPDGAVEVRGDVFRLVRFPEHLRGTDIPAAMVAWSRDGEPPDAVIAEVLRTIDDWGIDAVSWWVSDAAPETERALAARGARVTETVDVLARSLVEADAVQTREAGVAVALVRDEATLRAATFVRSEGWGQPFPDDARLAVDLAATRRALEDGTEFRVVATIDGVPVATGGCDVVDGVVRLWGAVTLPPWRRRGAYGALLRERMRLAARHGADLALVKGVVDTSAPILRRAGFEVHGEERCYELRASSPAGGVQPPVAPL